MKKKKTMANIEEATKLFKIDAPARLHPDPLGLWPLMLSSMTEEQRQRFRPKSKKAKIVKSAPASPPLKKAAMISPAKMKAQGRGHRRKTKVVFKHADLKIVRHVD